MLFVNKEVTTTTDSKGDGRGCLRRGWGEEMDANGKELLSPNNPHHVHNFSNKN